MLKFAEPTMEAKSSVAPPADPAAPKVSPSASAPNTGAAAYARRWLALHRGELRALALGAGSLLLFLLAWHLLSTLR